MTGRLQTEPFDIAAEIDAITEGRKDIGGIASFIGLVRDMTGGAAVATLELESYPAMAEKQLDALIVDAERRWPLLGCTIVHRYGRLEPGDPIVLVLCAAAGRREALDACDYLIEKLKTDIALWKRETAPSGDVRWIAPEDRK